MKKFIQCLIKKETMSWGIRHRPLGVGGNLYLEKKKNEKGRKGAIVGEKLTYREKNAEDIKGGRGGVAERG